MQFPLFFSVPDPPIPLLIRVKKVMGLSQRGFINSREKDYNVWLISLQAAQSSAFTTRI